MYIIIFQNRLRFLRENILASDDALTNLDLMILNFIEMIKGKISKHRFKTLTSNIY